MYNLTFSHSSNIGKIKVKVRPKTIFLPLCAPCTNRIAVLNNSFALICEQLRNKQTRAGFSGNLLKIQEYSSGSVFLHLENILSVSL